MASQPLKLRWVVFAALAILTFGVRLPRLSDRPMHTDEAVNAYITGQLLEGQSYEYDPRDRHGPVLYALAWPIARFSGATSLADLDERELRLGPVIVAGLMMFGFALLVNFMGFAPAVVAAILFSMAPISVYYSRYFIHETIFVAGTLGLINAFLRLLVPVSGTAARRSFLIQSAMAGFWAAIMLASKETAVLHFVAFGVAGGWWLLIRWRTGGIRSAEIPWRHAMLVALVVFVCTLAAFFSWGGHHWQGIGDLARSIPHLTSRASGEGHEKPFMYYFRLLSISGWSGALMIVSGMAGTLTVGSTLLATWNATRAPGTSSARIEGQPQRAGPVLGAPMAMQLLLIYAIALFIIYSSIPYKTPWLALNLWLPLALIVGGSFAALVRPKTGTATKVLMGAGLAALILLLRHDTRKWVFDKPADEKNPFAYAHTVEDLLGLPGRIAELASKQSTNSPRIAVIATDPWPLPWYLRKFSQVGFWQPGQETGPADFYITSPEAAERLAPQLSDRRPEYFGVRPEVVVILWPPPRQATDRSAE